jgi:uncharacterized protein (DUF488 family)
VSDLLIRTVGHGTLAADGFASLVQDAGVDLVVDIRSYPGSRRHPHFGREAMSVWLPDAGVTYEWEPRLGGRRRPSESSRNTALRNAAFRAYADHMETVDFAAGLDALIGQAETRSTAAMCAESLWWRCHRRLVADALVLVRGVHVEHLLHDGRLTDHRPSPEARVAGGVVVYDSPVGLFE